MSGGTSTRSDWPLTRGRNSRGGPHRLAMSVRDLVGEQFDDLVGFVGRGRQAQGFVGIAFRCRILLDPLHHAVIAPEYQTPLRRRLPEIVRPPGIIDQRMNERHPMAPLGTRFAPHDPELQGVYALDAHAT